MSTTSLAGQQWQDDQLINGVMTRRIMGWLADFVLLAILFAVLGAIVFALGFLTLGLGWSLMAALPFVPAVYYFLSMISPMQATPGQRLFGLVVVDNADLGPPTPAQVLIWVVVYLVTLPALWLLVLFALITVRRRLLHDLLSGLVVVRAKALVRN